MTTMFVRHKVSNYETWRKAYDDFASVQKAKGVTGQAVYQATDDPNDITATHDFVSVAAAQEFVNGDELKMAMQGGGVVGAPLVHQQKIELFRGVPAKRAAGQPAP